MLQSVFYVCIEKVDANFACLRQGRGKGLEDKKVVGKQTELSLFRDLWDSGGFPREVYLHQ